MMTFCKNFGTVTVGIILLTCSLINAQTKKDAADVYNQGVVSMSTNPDSAIIYFEKSIELSDKVGDDAKDIKASAIKILPKLYFNNVALLAKENKLTECIAASKITEKVADKYGNDTIKKETLKIRAIVYFSLGNNFYKNSELENAIACYDSALALNPNYTKVIVNKAMVYKKMENNDKFAENIDLAISQYKALNDTVQIAKLNKAARDHFKLLGSKDNQANKLPEALISLNTAVKYGFDKDIYYQFANIYNKQKKFDDALINAQKGLDLETGDEKAKAKYYYELGVAQLGKGDKDNACTSFKNAQFGAFVQAAKAQMINNKCPGATPEAK
jgi:tetratricopeptide (TPR) repeat protein